MNLKGKYIVIEVITTSQDNMNGNIHIIQSSMHILHGNVLHIIGHFKYLTLACLFVYRKTDLTYVASYVFYLTSAFYVALNSLQEVVMTFWKKWAT